MTSGAALSALRPGIHDWWGLGYMRRPEEYAQIFEMLRSDMYFERDVNMYGLGLAKVRPEGVETEFDSMGEGFKIDYIHAGYSNGFEITHQAVVDNLYMKVGEEYTAELGNAMRETKEIVCANILNYAFATTFTYADGNQLCYATHTLSGGGTFSNTASVASDLSEVALEQAVTQIRGYTDDRGKKILVRPKQLIVHPSDEFEARRILDSVLQSNTAENNLNVLRDGKYIPGGVMVYDYLTDVDAWFVQTDCPKGLRYFQREDLIIDSDVEFKTDSILVKAFERYSAGCTNVMGIWGSPGA